MLLQKPLQLRIPVGWNPVARFPLSDRGLTLTKNSSELGRTTEAIDDSSGAIDFLDHSAFYNNTALEKQAEPLSIQNLMLVINVQLCLVAKMLGSVEFTPAMVRGSIHPDSKDALAERLYLLRAAKGWTQAFAARQIGESQATWAYWESANNPRCPTSRQLVTIEIATGAPREWIQSGIGSRMPPILAEKLADAVERLKRGQGPRKRKN